MSIRARFTLLLGLLFGSLLLALLGLRALSAAEKDEILAADRAARSQLLNQWINTTSRELANVTTDIAEAEGFVAAVRRDDTHSARRFIAPETTGAAIAALWVVRADGVTVMRTANIPDSPAAPPLSRGELARLLAETPSPRFFADVGGRLVEFCARPVRNLDGGHWLVVARPWDTALLRALSSLTESIVSLRTPNELVRQPDQAEQLVLVRPLNDAAGRTLRVLRVDYTLPDAERALGYSARELVLFVAFGLLLLGALALAIRAWVLQPLNVISAGLASPSGSPAAPLTANKDEFGRVAQLVVSSAEQRAALEREVTERARAQEALTKSESALREHIADRTRLGRDLHDGVIQSLYAAGMNLVGIRSQLTPEQIEAAVRIEQTSSTLNESIRDLRNFIDGLEPEALRKQGFSQAIGDMIHAMGGMKPFQSSVELDERVASRLSLPQRIHALQITREAISNALRHGQANRIEISLRQLSGLVEFKIVDNGSGFDASSHPTHGKGLLNFTQRARDLGATLTVESHPGQGTIVTLTFSLP